MEYATEEEVQSLLRKHTSAQKSSRLTGRILERVYPSPLPTRLTTTDVEAVYAVANGNPHTLAAAAAKGINWDGLNACGFRILSVITSGWPDYSLMGKMAILAINCGLDPLATPPPCVYESPNRDDDDDNDDTIEEEVVETHRNMIDGVVQMGNAPALAHLLELYPEVVGNELLRPRGDTPGLRPLVVSCCGGPSKQSKGERDGRKKTLAILLKHAASAGATLEGLSSALFGACFSVSLPLIKALIKAGADPNQAKDPQAQPVFTPLHAVLTGANRDGTRLKALQVMIGEGGGDVWAGPDLVGLALGWYHHQCAEWLKGMRGTA